MPENRSIDFVPVSESHLHDLKNTWGEKAARHFHIDDGFMISATSDGLSVGLISSYWRTLQEPLPSTWELYIDFLEVHPHYRRHGIASTLIAMTIDRARRNDAYQVRSWSSVDKLEAIPMWKSLGFGLCPATVFPGGMQVEGFFVVRRIS